MPNNVKIFSRISVLFRYINARTIRHIFSNIMKGRFSYVYRLMSKTVLNRQHAIHKKGMMIFLDDKSIECFAERNHENIMVLDHALGGGSNQYREKIVKKFIEEGKVVFLIIWDIYNSFYSFTYFFGEYKVEYKLRDIFDIENVFRLAGVKELIINEFVSLNNPYRILKFIQDLKVKYKFKVQIPIHDYFVVCPSYTLLNNFGKYCFVPRDYSICNKCLKKHGGEFKIFNTYYENITEWRKRFAKFLSVVDEIICFSQSSKNILLKAYPRIEGKIAVIPHVVDYLPSLKSGPARDNDVINIGFIGAINYEKGLVIIKDMLKLIRKKKYKNIKIVIIGTTSEAISDKNLIITGVYDRQKLPDLANKYKINLFLISSICPETFSFTTEEVIKMNVPVAVFNIGAQAERVKKYKKGLVISEIDAKTALLEVIKFYNDFKSAKKNLS